MKIVINTKYGGFGLSEKGFDTYRHFCRVEGREPKDFAWDIPRNDPALVRAVDMLNGEASDDVSRLKIVSIPDDVAWVVQEGQGGIEWVAEVHRTWR